jgi:hypothetical protein
MIIAERILSLQTASEVRECRVLLRAPEYLDGMWICRYEIGWPDDPDTGFGAGVDAFQALHLTLQLIGFRLYASAYHKAGTLVFEQPGRGYGFPIPKNGRDLLIGDDKIFDG